MKRCVAILAALLLVFGLTNALAAGKLRVTQENFHVIDSYGIYGNAYARIDNVGDKPIKVNAGILEIFDTEGDALTSTDYMSKYAEYLQPGEYTYVSMRTEVKDVEASQIDDYLLTITGKSENKYISQRFPCTTSYEPGVEAGYWTHNYMYATFTNDTDKPIYGIEILLVLLDAEGNILYMDDASMYSDKALMPGGAITVRKDVSSSYMDYFKKSDLVPASVDAIAFVEVDLE